MQARAAIRILVHALENVPSDRSHFALIEELPLGRSSVCDGRLSDPSVSARAGSLTGVRRGGFPRLADPDAELFDVLGGPRAGESPLGRLALLLASLGDRGLRLGSARSHEVRPGRLLAPRRVARAGRGARSSPQVLASVGVPLLRARAR